VILEEGETVDGVNFALLRGGVISGRVTNADGQPMIEEQVHLTELEEKNQRPPVMRINMNFNQTDDRGMYRIYGLPPGKYKVSAGTRQTQLSFASRKGFKYKQTFHPSVTDVSQATVIEVTEGSEATNVDIVLSLRESTYSASGRIIDGETGRPISNARFELTKIVENGSSGTSGPVTNALGEFKIESLTPGKYMVTLEPTNNNFYAEGVHFEINDQDIKDLVIKTSSGASVSGVVVFEGLDVKTARQKYGQIMIMVHLAGNGRFANRRSGPPVNVGPDGSFTVGGLAAGEGHFMIFSQSGSENGRNFEVARIERDGMVQQRTLDIKEREHVTGVRVIINPRNGMLQGIVKVENGQLGQGRLWVSLRRPGETGGYGVPLDARGRFRMGGLAAGTYEITASAYINSPAPPSTKQQIVITDDQVTEVTLILDLKSAPRPDRP
jgi:protocatechuate 3,4-dioxygenase beta subunit